MWPACRSRPKRRTSEDFTAAWQRVCVELRNRPGTQGISDEAIGEEVARHRAGQ